MKMPCTVPILGFEYRAHQSILTLSCFCSNLQPCTNVIYWYLGHISPGVAWFWPELGVDLEGNFVIGLKHHALFPSHALQSLLVSKVKFRMLLQQSAIMRTCDFGQIVPNIVRVLNFWGSAWVYGVLGWKIHVWFPSQYLQTPLMHQLRLWSASAAVCNHAYMRFGPNQP